MQKYDLGDLYMGLTERLFAARRGARAAGGTNNIQERGHGPEQVVRDVIQNMIGRSYRVTHGHVVRSDKRKSKQIDVIVARDRAVADLQLHLSSWYEEYSNPLSYSAMGERRRVIGQQAETGTQRGTKQEIN